MAERVEFNDISVHEDDEQAYEVMRENTDNKYENLKINTLAEAMKGPSTVSDGPTRTFERVNASKPTFERVNASKPEVGIAAFRKLDIAFAIISGMMLLMLVICLVTIGILIHQLNRRADKAEIKSDELQAMVSKLQNKSEVQLGPWSLFSTCSATCGTGTHYRTRSCNDSSQELNGWWCPRADIDIQPCNIEPCQAEWGVWSQFSECSQSCGGGRQSRKRACINTSSAECSGDSSESRPCNTENCPVNGGWSNWYAWSSCTKTCDGGEKRRHRYCNNPTPAGFGRACIGNSDETSVCNGKPCSDRMVGFTAYGRKGYTNGRVTFNYVITSYGGGFNKDTGTFTCPVSGLYIVIMMIQVERDDHLICWLYKNGGTTGIQVDINGQGQEPATQAGILRLYKGDTLYIGGCSSANVGDETLFSAGLIQAS